MLSKENADKIVLTGLYKHEPDVKYRDSLYSDNLYHCFNWTFIVRHYEKADKWYMVDTYFKNEYIELTDDNFDEFEFLFDFTKVEKHSGEHIYEYDESDWLHVAVDSSGMYGDGKFFLKKGAVKNKERVIERIKSEIYRLECDLKYKKALLEGVKNGEVDLNYV